MKKLGLCVRYDCNNFGSMLQILATQKIIEQLSWDYEIIRYDKRTISFYVSNLTRLFNLYFMKGKLEEIKRKIQLKKYPEMDKNCKCRVKHFEDFRNRYIGPYSNVFKGYNALVKGAENYDAIMVGSDQLWLPAGIKSKFYNLLFVPDNVKKISFATSFGVGAIPNSQKKMTAKYIERIEFISVREIIGARFIKELTGRDVLVALDPTLLLNGDQWRELFPESKIIKEPYIFAYLLGKNEKHRDAVERLKKATGLKVVTVPFMDSFVKRDLHFGDEAEFEIGPIEFLNLIRGAEYICTDSFHGSVFSILNHKQFITFNRKDNNDKMNGNSRIDSLFELLDLKERRYDSTKDLKNAANQYIDYDSVDKKLVKLRHETMNFLSTALNPN